GANSTYRTAYMTSPVLNCTGYSNIMWTFEHHYDDDTKSIAYLETNIDGGGWTTIATLNADNTNATTATYPVSGAAGSANVQLRYRYYAKKNYYWAIDDIQVTGQAAPYSAWASNGATGTSTSTAPITAGRTGLSGFSQFAIAVGIGVLPIELIEFNATVVGDNVELNWVTVSELNNDFFTIEKTINGIDFEYVGTVKGVGTSDATNYYDLLDLRPHSGVSYYRLKQTDFNGAYKYSEVIAVNFEQVSETSLVTELFPNPSYGFATFTFNGESNQSLNVSVINQLGAVVIKQNHTSTDADWPCTISTKTLANGMYQVIFTRGDEMVTQKLTVRN
ncbi:MAG: T9SS type A sorting domain-containing protein, partial [Crocinitomicaceae bacterium]|nr:T9SS type A sorting domain-containing protein [Crocinitomicaceae bacterium]